MTKSKQTSSSQTWRAWLNPKRAILPRESFPLYDLNRRYLKWASTDKKAHLWIRAMLIVPCTILIAVWFLVAVNDNRWGDSTYGYLSIVFIATMTFFSFLLDFSSMVVTFNSINSEKTLGRWDLLVLATEKDHISRSKHAFTRLRIARVLAFNLSVRIAVLLFPVLMVTVWGYLSPMGSTFTSLIDYAQDFPLESFAIVMFCIPAVLFVLLV